MAQFEKWVDGELFEAQANSDIRDEQRASMAWLIVAAASAWVPIAIAIWWYYAVRN